MGQFSLPQQAATAANTSPIPLSLPERAQWNAFLDYLDKRGFKGNTALDDRNKGLGQQLMEEYRAQNPSFTLTYGRVPAVQQDLQNYRQSLIQKWKANPKVTDAKSADEILPNISPVDGWLGSRTSSYKYPAASLTNSDGSVQNFGLNTAAYDAAIANVNKK